MTIRSQCRHCRQDTDHRRLCGETIPWEYELTEETGGFGSQGIDSWDIVQCCGCQTVSVRHTSTHHSGLEQLRIYPPVPTRVHRLPAHAPGKIRRVLDETHRALDADCRTLAAMGARAIFDMVMSEQTEQDSTFEQGLKNLVAKGVTSERSSEILKASIGAGHAAAHRGYAPTKQDIHAVMTILENLLESVYELRPLAERLKAETPQRPPKPQKPH